MEEWHIPSVQLWGGFLNPPRLPDVDHSAAQWTVAAISSTFMVFLGMCHILLHTSTQCPGTSLHVKTFIRPSATSVLQVTNTGVRRPGYEANQNAQQCIRDICLCQICHYTVNYT